MDALHSGAFDHSAASSDDTAVCVADLDGQRTRRKTQPLHKAGGPHEVLAVIRILKAWPVKGMNFW